MKIINNKLTEDLIKGIPIKQDIGCGQNPFDGLYSMNYFCSTESQPKSRVVPNFYKSVIIDHILAPIFFRAANINFFIQDFYERRLSSFFTFKALGSS